jgi:nitric oxide reductase NorE protein
MAAGLSIEGAEGASELSPSESLTRRMPGETGIWVLVAGDLAVFSIFFIVLLVQRWSDRALFVESQHSLNQTIGALNTFIMLTSSLFVALGVGSIRSGSIARRSAPYFIATAAALGLGFVLVKAYEWSERFSVGQTVGTNDFFMFYFRCTGIHLVHVIVGLIVLAILYILSRRPSLDQGAVLLIESGGIFWHLVDLLWIILFALFYLVT